MNERKMGIKSDLTSKQFKSPQMREFEVSDESWQEPGDNEDDRLLPFNPNDIDSINAFQASRGFPPVKTSEGSSMPPQRQISRQEYDAAKKDKITGRSKLSDSARRRVQKLCGMYQEFKEIVVGENSFIVKTLETREMRSALSEAQKHEGTPGFVFELRNQFLARSLVSIGDVDIEDFLENPSIEGRVEFLESLPEAVLNAVNRGYVELTNEVDNKYNPKTAKEMEEVVSDIKK